MMFRGQIATVAAFFVLSLKLGNLPVHSQQEVGFIERFALSDDRRQALTELIPGTEEFYYYHCLHFQNQKQLSEADAILDQWRAKFGDTAQLGNMRTRQVLLAYDVNPSQALDYLQRNLNLNFNLAPPAKDRAAALASELDNSSLTIESLLESALSQDRSLGQLETSGLRLVLDRQLAPDQLRALIGRLERADVRNAVKRIAEELQLKDTRGFGWANVHSLLTLAQLDELLQAHRDLIENDSFIRTYAARLAPPEGSSLTDKVVLRAYLDRLLQWSRKLPASQNSFKVLVLGNLLRLNLSENKFDRQLFLEYLSHPRSAPYYDLRRARDQRVPMANLGYAVPEVPLPPMADDSELVLRHLEHFFQGDKNVDSFAGELNREYLDKVFAETKILNGIGDPATWYAKLSPSDQKQLRERVEIRFAPHNPSRFKAGEPIRLDVEVKNVADLLIKIYEINTLSYFQNHDDEISTNIDLDGLVANSQRQLTFAQPGDLRHTETIDLPSLEGRGVWVIDLLGAGQRSRALIQKGALVAAERLGDAGHVFQIYNEEGQPVPSAHVEMGGRKYESDKGKIILPYAEETVTRRILLVDGDFASRTTIAHFSEAYDLTAAFLLDRQSLVAGTQAAVAINTRLTCNGVPISISLLENPKLTISATDADGITTSSTVDKLDLDDGDELVHSFLVPQRLTNIRCELSGQVYNQNRDEKQTVSVGHSVSCNGIAASSQIGDFFLQHLADGYRVLVLGRNGEPVARLPVSLSVKARDFKNLHSFTLATDELGTIRLGALEQVEWVRMRAEGIELTDFPLSRFHRHWPGNVQLASGQSLELPLGKDTSDKSFFSLVELRRGVPQASQIDKLKIDSGSLTVSGLEPGDYMLTDHEVSQSVRLFVSDGSPSGEFAVGTNRILQTGRRAPLVIRDVELGQDEIRIRIDGADPLTRVHVVADVFSASEQHGSSMVLPDAPLTSKGRNPIESFYVNSLRLDEEYSYILNRHGLKKYPGNMLPQPSLLIHPWEISVTENQIQQAAAGDAIPQSSARPDMQADTMAEGEARLQGVNPDWKSFDFLAGGAAVLANLGVVDGEVRVPLKSFAGYSSLTILAVHPTGSDSRQVVRGDGQFPTRDQRLRSAFDSTTPLAQTQRIEFLPADGHKVLGDPKTRRLQTYTTLADVFQLYSTLLEDPNWEKFRFVTAWNQLSDAEKQAQYNTVACHELNFFLYCKDRPFFDAVVKPFLSQKLDKQLVDHWLLGESIAEYNQLWRTQRLNTLERILLAQSIETARVGTERWLDEFLAANPIPAQERQRRFEVALRGTALDTDSKNVNLYFDAMALEAAPSASFQNNAMAGGGMGGYGGGGYGGEAKATANFEAAPEMPGLQGARGLQRSRALREMEQLGEVQDIMFGDVDRLSVTGGRVMGLFQSLDKTKEWAETNYYQTKLAEQTSELIPPGPFWRQYLATGKPFLPNDLDLPCSAVNEALCALAVIDLPFEASSPKLVVEDEQLVMSTESPAIVFLESIEKSRAGRGPASILAGQDIFLANPNTAEDANRPVQSQPLLRGVPYRTSVVVTNPSNQKQRVDVLTQLPAGSLPLSGSKTTRSTALDLAPYSTAQVEYTFYFPAAGDFDHYGAQISRQMDHITATPASTLRVLAEPESVDETTWSYIADWGTNEQVLGFLRTANLQQLDLSRIAFRMQDRPFYDQVLSLLSTAGRYEQALWAFSVRHNDQAGIEQLLQQRADLISQLGSVFESPLVRVIPGEQFSYEHLDYKPLVVARTHQLGTKRTILNPSLHQQYARLLDVLAHQATLSGDQHLQICYYLLLQNRIDEALTWFGGVSRSDIHSDLQYDYFDAYLEFYRGDYSRAARIAGNYAAHPVPRWNALFSQIRRQVEERSLLDTGRETSLISLDKGQDPSQKLLTDQREIQQQQAARQTPALDVELREGTLIVQHRNVEDIKVNYYLMDIELLFSRNPFVSQSKGIAPVIQPNLSEKLEVADSAGQRGLDLPNDLKNRNLLVEVSASGISRSTVITANSLRVTVVEPYGQLQVLAEQGRGPVERAYVKVYARHRDGTVRFYKDGYTDLRGQFEYATLSTGDLDSVDKFSILVLHDELGASVQEADPPTR